MSWLATPMEVADIAGVRAIEQASFSTTWQEDAFLTELKQNPSAHYLVLRPADDPQGGRVAAYAGIWQVEDEAHITSLAVHPDLRGSGLGTRLLYELVQLCCRLGARWATLEVRADNEPACRLYRRFGFVEVGRRKNYYSGGEEARIMWAGNLLSEPYQARLSRLGGGR